MAPTHSGSPQPADLPVHPGLTGPVLTSPQSKRIKEAGKLLKRQWRNKTGHFLVEGPQAVREALAGDAPIVDAFMTAESAERNPDLLELASGRRVRLRQIADDLLPLISDTVASQGVVLVCEQRTAELTAVVNADAKLLVVLSQVRDPGNAGTVIRVADAAGADGVIITSNSVDAFNPKVVRSTAGSLFHLPIVTGVGLSEVTELARARGQQVLAADAHPPAHDLHVPWDTGLDLSRPTLWVFGSEAHGLPEADRALCDAAVAIPLYGQAESLNLATAASICIYESARSQLM